MTNTKPLALYARVSTAEQTVDAQLHQLRRYAESWDAEAVEFVDTGVSGAKDSRPGLNDLLAAARRREVGTVVCTKLDRLARSTRHLCNLAAEFEALGVDLVILDLAADTSTPMGKLLFTMLAGVAEFERELIRERVCAGMKAARAKGKKIGRPAALGKTEVARVRRMREAGRSWRHIGRVLGVSHATALAALKS
jgi:DNA invertase Pin-like site-specific DNA recombinase